MGKNLLILSPGYPDAEDRIVSGPFVKNQVNALRPHFDNIYVIVPLPPFSINYTLALQNWKYAKDYSYDNVKVFYVHHLFLDEFRMLGFMRSTVYKSIQKAIEKVISSNNLKFDLIHVHFTQPLGHVASLLSKKYGVPYLITIHEQAFSLESEIKSGRPDILDSWRNADALIRVNKFDIDIIKQYNPNVYYAPNGYPEKLKCPPRDYCRKKLGLPENQKIIFSLGVICDRKGYFEEIHAISRLRVKNPELHCYIAGYGGKLGIKKYTRLAHSLSLDDCVHILGKIPSEDIALWFGACDIFVLASRAEGNPTVMFEALGCGRPYVGTNVGGVCDIITDEKYGILCEPRDIDALVECIQKGLDKKWDEKAILEYGLTYTWENVMEREVLPIYRLVLP